MIFSPGANPRLRVNSPAQVIVQITALRHPKKKVTKLQRILARRLEVGFGALLQTCLRAPGLRRFGLTRSRHGED